MENLNDDQSVDNQVYYDEIIRYLQDPTRARSTTDAQWVKTQATNYFLKDGELFYGRRKPRLVVLDEETKNSILNQIHIDKTKGFHNGVKKMHRILQKQYFWRYSYKSITEYIKKCAVCKSIETSTPCIIKSKKSLSPWNEIELHRIKPVHSFQNDSYFVIIYDPVSFWVSAAAIKPGLDDMAEFLLENLCSHGVASCKVYGLDSVEFPEFKKQFTQIAGVTDIVPGHVAENIITFSEEKSTEYDSNLKAKVESFFQKHPEDWSKRTNILGWLWKLRNEMINDTSALIVMSSHGFTTKTNREVKLRKITKTFPCLSCDETFESPIMLQLHASSHTATERFTRSSNSKHQNLPNQSSSDSHSIPDNRISTSTTVAAVKALIAQTKEVRKSREERHKRGEYHRYTPEMREAIAIHALRHGTHSAVRTFTASLGFSVSYSSVRNFVQAHQAFSSQVKLEIGRYAAECGIDAAQKHYTTKLNKSISTALIRKFRRIYLRMTPASQLGHHSGSQRKTTSVVRHLFCTSVREEIGKYAALHGVQVAVRHFSEKLQFPVKESTVRKFKKIFGSPTTTQIQRSHQVPLPPPSPEPSLPPPPPLSILQQHQTSESNFYHQPYGHYTTSYNNHQPIHNYHSHHQNLYVMPQPLQPVPPYPSYNSLPPPPQYQPSVSSVQLPAYSRNWNEECTEVSTPVLQPPDNSQASSLIHQRSFSPVAPPLPPPPPPLELNPVIERQESRTAKKKTTKKIGRGSYATYSPQFRLEIGRFAVEYGCQEAVQFFRGRVGHEIPESTVRGLRDKYVAQQNSCDEVSSLNVLPRGRPLRLGPHDAAVQECIRELKRSGVRVNAFVAIATARQVILQKEPSLLTEFGGSLKLTTNWAKSFLKRIGINKENSSQDEASFMTTSESPAPVD